MNLKYEAEHTGGINTITFIDEGWNFVTTADEKKICSWQFGIPVMIKHVLEPDMYPIPAAKVHPNGKYWVGQSMNNSIVVYDLKYGFKINRKKRFAGH